MTALVYSPRFATALEGVFEFAAANDPRQAGERVDSILDALQVLKRHPLIGRRVAPRLRELVIGKGAHCHVALYSWDPANDRVIVLSVRHARQAGYR